MLVGYDLQAAKQAYRIQEKEKPKFDKLFVKIGGMHCRMSYYAAVGYFLAGSGLLEIPCDCDLLGSSSITGFQTGRHYNRCERIHPILYITLSELHIQRFLDETYEDHQFPREILDILKSFGENPTLIIVGVSNPELVDVIQTYEKFCEKTRNGKLGKTPQYAMIYMDIIRS